MPTKEPKIERHEPAQEQPETAPRGKREEIFNMIENSDDQIPYIRRVFEHSIEDGLALVKRFNLRDEDLAMLVSGTSFAMKHRGVYERIIMDVVVSGAVKNIDAWHAPRNSDTVFHIMRLGFNI